MRTRDTTGLKLVSLLLVCIVPALAYAHTLAPGLTWANNGSDGGDLITAIATAGVPHPTGYPTYIALVSLFQALPIGDPAFCTNVFSAFAAIATLIVLYEIIATIIHTIPSHLSPWLKHASAIIATSVLAFSPMFWSQAIIAEVYTLNALFVALLIRFTLHTLRQTPHISTWTHRIHALVAGLALGNHLTIIFPVAGWLVVSSIHAIPHRSEEHCSIRSRITHIALHCGKTLLWCGIGSLVYLLLPLRAAAHPPINWGNASTWGGFWWLVSAQPYRGMLFGVPFAHLGGRVAAWAAFLMHNTGGIVGITIACIGVIYAYHLLPYPTRRIFWLNEVLAGTYSLFALAYNTTDSNAYLIPVIMLCAIWIGVGYIVMLSHVQRWSHPLMIPLALALTASFVWHIPNTYRAVDASHDHRATAYATTILQTAPPNAIVITSGDRDTFTLWYYHYAQGKRSDIVIVVEPMLAFPWYQEQMHIMYPTIDIHRLTTAIRTQTVSRFDTHHICYTLLDTNNSEVLECRTEEK